MSRLRAKQGLALFIFATVSVTGVLGIFQPQPTTAATFSTLNFQARLETAGGAIVPDGSYNVEFKLYDLSTSSGSSQGSCSGDADCLWTETRTSSNQVKVINGYLTVNLGSVTSFPTTINWNQQLWLTMRIGGTGTPSWDAEMSPRIQLTAVPYAFQAGELGNGTNRATLDSSGNLTLQQASTVSTSTGNLTLQAASALALQSAGGTSSSNVTIQSGNASAGNSGNISLDVGTATGAKGSISIGSTNPAAAINIGAVGSTANATTLHLADSTGAAQTITVGGTNTSSSTSNASTTVNIQGGATGLNVATAGVTIQTWADSPSAFKVQNSSSANLFTVDTSNSALVLGNDGATSAITVRGGAATSSNTTGSNITFDASNGTGVGGSGDFIFRTAGPAATAITLDNYQSATANGNTNTTTTWTHTPGSNSNQILIVSVATARNQSVSTVTYEGTALTKLSSQLCPATTFTPYCEIELWYMVNPATSGTHQISVTITPGSSVIAGGSVTYYNVNTSSPFGTVSAASGATTGNQQITNSVTTTSASQLVIDALASDNTTGTPGGTQLWSSNGNLFVYNNGSSKAGTGGSVSMTWFVNGGDWTDLAVPLNPVTNTAPDTLADRLHVTAAGNVGINTATPQHTLDVAGTQNVAGALSLGTASSATGTLVFNNVGGANTITIQSGTTSASYTLTLPTAVGSSGDCLKASNGTGSLIWGTCGGAGGGGVTLQASTPGTPDTGNFNISGTGIAATLYAATFDASSGVALNIGNSNATSINIGKTGSNILTTINGTALIKPTTGNDSTTAFQIQNASGRNLFTVDTSNSKVGVGISVPSNSLSVSPLDYQTGTVTRTNGSATLVGTGTTWTSSMVGDIIVFADGTTNTVSAFTDATHVTMGTTYAGTTDASPVSYRFHLIGLQVTSSSYVGIGTTAPVQELEVYSNANASRGIHITNVNTGASAWSQLELATSTQQYNIGVGGSGTSLAGTLAVFDQTNSKFRLVVTSGGNVGIGGVTNPSMKLAIQGNVASTTASFEGLLQLNASDGQIGELYHNNNATNSYLGIESYNVGNTVKTPFVLQEFGGNVGIGTNNPSRSLDIKDSGALTIATATTYAFGVGNALQGDFTIGSDSSNAYLQSWNSKPLEINNQGNNIYLVPSSGNVGIRTTSTSYPLDVNGVIRSSAGVIATGDDNGGSGGQLRVIGGSYGFFLRNDGSNLYLLQTAGGDQYGSWTANRQLIAPVNSDNIYFSNNGGNVGIGTTSTGHKLTVTKTISGGKVVGFNNFTTTDSSTTGILELRGGWTSGVAANSRYIQFYDSATSDTNGIGEGSVISRAGGVTYNNANADFGEYFDLYGPIQYGDIATGTWVDGKYVAQQASTNAPDLIGVMSYKTGFAGNGRYLADGSLDTSNRDTIGFLGQIATHVSDINGSIHAGDPIGLSAIPGYGVKAITAGQIVGHAMEDFDPAAGSATSSCPAGSPSGASCGTIQVLVNVTWYDPSAETSSNLQGANFANLNITGDLNTYHLTVTSDATFKANIIVEGHVITGGDTPTVAAGTAAGTDLLGHVEGACTINGNDTSGTLSLVAGFDNLASGAQCTITFAKPFDAAPRPVMSATNKESTGVGVYAQTSATQMTIYFSQMPQAGQQYNFNYWNPQ